MKKIEIAKDFLISEYQLQGRTARQIAKQSKCAVSTINRWLRVYGIPRHGFQVQDLSGVKFGKWTVLERAPNDEDGRVRWRTKCTCGNISNVDAYTLKRSKSTKCRKCTYKTGDKHPTWTGYKEISGSMWNRLRYNKKEVTIDIRYGWDLFVSQNRKCALSGLPIKFGSCPEYETTASLDRIDSSRGYVEGNVQWVHKAINRMKLDLDEDLFKHYCRLIVENDQC